MTQGEKQQSDGGSRPGDRSEHDTQKASIGSQYEEKQLGLYSDITVAKRLWEFIAPYRWTFAGCLLLLPLLSGLKLLQPHLLQVAIDSYLVPGKYEGIGLVIGFFGLAVLGQGLVQFVQFYFMQKAGQSALYDLRQKLFGHVQSQSLKFFHSRPVGRLMARLTTDVESLQNAVTSGMITMIGDGITLLGIVIILLYKNWQLALVSFTVLPFLLVVTAIFRHFLRKAYRTIRVKVARLYAHLQESINGMHVIQMFVREDVSAEEHADINAEYRNANFRSIRYDAMLYAVVEAVGSITIGAIIWYGSGQVLEDLVSIGVLVAFIEYMKKFFVPIRDIAQKYNLLQSALTAGERVIGLLDTDMRLDSVRDNSTDGAEPVPDRPHTFEFDDVWFRYNSDGEWVIKGMNFDLEPGQNVALVGHTGAGKSTLAKLIMRLHDVTEGQITLNGTDISAFDARRYRKLFASVQQDCFLFQGTIAENIALFDPNISRDRIVDAAKQLHIHERIVEQLGGYDRELTERGSNLSVGEKQLLTLARAFVKEPTFLVLDEATANVDAETENLLQNAIELLLERQTSIVIAHRLSTIKNADKILVLDDGEIIERGNHRELIDQGGHYETLFRLQFMGHDLEKPTNSSQVAQ